MEEPMLYKRVTVDRNHHGLLRERKESMKWRVGQKVYFGYERLEGKIIVVDNHWKTITVWFMNGVEQLFHQDTKLIKPLSMVV